MFVVDLLTLIGFYSVDKGSEWIWWECSDAVKLEDVYVCFEYLIDGDLLLQLLEDLETPVEDTL